MTFEAGLSRGGREELMDHVSEGALAAHPGTEPRIVDPAASEVAKPVEDLRLAVGGVAIEPLLEQRGDGQREAKRDVSREPARRRPRRPRSPVVRDR